MSADSVVETTAERTDEVRTNLAVYTLYANVENLTYSGAGAFAESGNAADIVITYCANIAPTTRSR